MRKHGLVVDPVKGGPLKVNLNDQFRYTKQKQLQPRVDAVHEVLLAGREVRKLNKKEEGNIMSQVYNMCFFLCVVVCTRGSVCRPRSTQAAQREKDDKFDVLLWVKAG